MFLLRALLILLVLAVTPPHAASPVALAGHGGMSMAGMDHPALPECCQDGSHQMPSCQMQTDLAAGPALAAPPPRIHALRIPLRSERLTGRMPDLALPPPRSA